MFVHRATIIIGNLVQWVNIWAIEVSIAAFVARIKFEAQNSAKVDNNWSRNILSVGLCEWKFGQYKFWAEFKQI